MKILFDQGTPVPLRAHLVGHTVDTVYELGWSDLQNSQLDEIEASTIADEIMRNAPEIGYLTISNALQWRLQYRRVIDNAGSVPGVIRLR